MAFRPIFLRSDGLLNGGSSTGTRIRYDTFFYPRLIPSGYLAMRRVLFSVLILSLLAGCSLVQSVQEFGPHRIDVQQGNALDPESVARLKPGLNRSQVRFLLGTPLVVDPFRNDRWDYVYILYHAGTLVEQKRISLFFDGDTLTRIEGDVPAAVLAAQPPAAPAPVLAEAKAAEAKPVPVSEPVVAPATAVVTPALAAAPPLESANPSPKALSVPTPSPAVAASSIVPPLPNPKNAPAYVDPHTPAEPSLSPGGDAAPIKPDAAAATNDPVQVSLNAWANAWARRDEAAYFAAYASSFVPQGGGSRADWETRQRMLFAETMDIDLKIESPSVARGVDGSATVTFNQFYRSGSFREDVVKQLRMVERAGRWLIVEEKALSVLPGNRP
ncbi:MAG: outer membrane protein assembly factor BamE [Thiobacillus sp.]|nr:outer membrane protein assembly factor BamE [Thiobacillus sp.]